MDVKQNEEAIRDRRGCDVHAKRQHWPGEETGESSV